MDRKNKAKQLFLKGNNCAQAVFAAFSDITGIDEKSAFFMASSFGGGMGHIGEACGAVTGMLMAAGPLLGYGENATAEVKQGYYKEVKALTDEFKAEFGGLRCPALMARLNGGEYNLPDDEDYKSRPCLIFVEKAVEILEKKLERQGK